jgi:hypothetical protein
MKKRYPRVAIKKCDICEDSELKELENEIHLMSMSVHPNVTEYIESFLWRGREGICTLILVKQVN